MDLDGRLAEALVSLLAHDLRSPLAPLQLALSTIEDEPGATPEIRELALIAGAQAARAARLIDAASAAVRGARAPVIEPVDLRGLLDDAAFCYEALGGTCVVEGDAIHAGAERRMLRDAIASLMECAGGEGGSVLAAVEVSGGAARMMLSGTDPTGSAHAMAATDPADWRSALALGARAVVAAHGGEVRLEAGAIVAELPL